MPSQLTRVVFRKLAANELVAYSGCLRRTSNHHYAISRQSLPRSQRRHFLNMFRQPERQAAEANIDPGLERLMHFAKMERLKARLPPSGEIAKAFTKFFTYRQETGEPIEDVQAQYALQALNYLRKTRMQTKLTSGLLRDALKALALPSHQASPSHRDLAVSLWETAEHVKVRERNLPLLINALCSMGEAAVAREYLVGGRGQEIQSGQERPVRLIGLWNRVLRGFMAEKNGTEMHETLKIMEENGVSILHTAIASTMAQFSASAGDVEGTRLWYDRYKHIDTQTSPEFPEKGFHFQQDQEHLQDAVLQLCMSASQLDFGQSIVRDITRHTPSKRQWDMLFAWAASTGKGVDEIGRMMGVMEKANQGLEESERLYPDIETINRLVKLAISRNEPYAAERFIALGKERKIEPDARTLVLQIDYRLSVHDVDGALVAYKHLQTQDVSEGQDVLTVNNLICAMCASGRQDFDSIMNVAADLSDRRARFEPSTVSALSLLHLSRNEIEDVSDLLNTHVYKFSNAERASVRDTIVAYCVSPSTTTARAWDTYVVIKEIFDETAREQRTQIMNDFFRRQRADMAVHVFNHMRTHTRPDTMSTVETYVSCYVGIARSCDLESLEVVHNQMKLDYSIEPNTHLRNALILAYTTCESPRRALSFWDEIVSSREGPTINSIHLAFRACEVSPWGDQKAREIWARLSRTGIELDQAMWASYLAGLVGNGDVLNSVRTLEEAHATDKVEVNALIIGSIYNAAPGKAKKEEVEAWAKVHFPHVWSDLESMGSRQGQNGMRLFGIDRSIDP